MGDHVSCESSNCPQQCRGKIQHSHAVRVKKERTHYDAPLQMVIDMIGLVIKPLLGIFLVALEVNSKSCELPKQG